MKKFDPNGSALPDSGIFGLPHSLEEANTVIIPAPWEATVSYGSGASDGPSSMLLASKYVELFDKELGNFYENGIAMPKEPTALKKANIRAKNIATKLIEADPKKISLQRQKDMFAEVNRLCEYMNDYVFIQTNNYLRAGKIVGLAGGEHSVSLGCIRAHIKKYPKMGILQIDAHADLRESFEGFTYSHASIMFNVLKEVKPSRLVQVGVRDYCEEEYSRIQQSHGRVVTFFDRDLIEGSTKTWSHTCERVVAQLPSEVYISLDVDGLDPVNCPNTGTPVPGGLTYKEVILLIKKLADSGRKIVGFDLVEVAPYNAKDPHDWNANVGAHLLYQLAGWCMKTNPAPRMPSLRDSWRR